MISGVEMFVQQGARQFEIWTGKPAPEAEMHAGGGARTAAAGLTDGAPDRSNPPTIKLLLFPGVLCSGLCGGLGLVFGGFCDGDWPEVRTDAAD